MEMINRVVNILMLEDNPADVRLIQETLKDGANAQFNLEHAGKLADGLERLKTNSVDVILLDPGLPDSQGLETIKSLATQIKKLPIIVLTGLDDEVTALAAMQYGAQDYLVKGQVEGITLWRSLRYAIERKRSLYQNEVSLKIMKILNQPGEMRKTIREILSIIKDFSGCEAAGIRLKQGKDYPFFETSGFYHQHSSVESNIESENQNLSAQISASCDMNENCLCSLIIQGNYDRNVPCFTGNGSFLTGNSLKLYQKASKDDREFFSLRPCYKRNYQSVAIIPLRTHDHLIGLINLCDRRPDIITYNQIEFFEGIVNSIGVVLGQKRAEEKLQKSYDTLKKTLNDAINTLVKVVEMRDPYTSGHQTRVANLAVAIAREMKIDEEQIDHLWMAALVHDIGKINVPSDILSKPGQLTDMELKIIQTHAQGGYDIVKSMDFPCAVARSIVQHHERLDGSGYPMQLEGNAISLEARILAVADVIEAMSSHRPYRPSLGIDAALAEITKNSGKLFDQDVVKICSTLFKEKRFQFKE